MYKIHSYFVVVGCCLVLAGCQPTIGKAPGNPPPQLIQSNDGPLWDNVSSFGPVPAGLENTASSVCGRLKTEDGEPFVAAGYHPRAVGLDGAAFKGGGYYCVSP